VQPESNAKGNALGVGQTVGEFENRGAQLLQGRKVELHFSFDACGPDDAKTRAAGLGKLVEQRRLANTRFAVDDEDGPVAVARRSQDPLEHASFALSSDQSI
jgi:hypothetical protein